MMRPDLPDFKHVPPPGDEYLKRTAVYHGLIRDGLMMREGLKYLQDIGLIAQDRDIDAEYSQWRAQPICYAEECAMAQWVMTLEWVYKLHFYPGHKFLGRRKAYRHVKAHGELIRSVLALCEYVGLYGSDRGYPNHWRQFQEVADEFRELLFYWESGKNATAKKLSGLGNSIRIAGNPFQPRTHSWLLIDEALAMKNVQAHKTKIRKLFTASPRKGDQPLGLATALTRCGEAIRLNPEIVSMDAGADYVAFNQGRGRRRKKISARQLKQQKPNS